MQRLSNQTREEKKQGEKRERVIWESEKSWKNTQWNRTWRNNPVENVDCILDMTQNYLMVRLHPWSFVERQVHIHGHYSRVYHDPEWWYEMESHLWVK